MKELPSTIDHVVALMMLYLADCKMLVHIPSSIYNLMFLVVLELNGCTNLSKFPNYVGEVHDNFKLSILNLSGNKFVSLPSIRKLSKLSAIGLLIVNYLGKFQTFQNGFLRDSEIEIILSGSDIPDWFSHKSSIKELLRLSVKLLDESNSCVGSLSRENIVLVYAYLKLVYAYLELGYSKLWDSRTVEWR
ncbi:hypothetical protein FEM48_Zijuj05G0176300 [Ziziphus jujuba var. spinosa]|uniref:Uncharacterized protein n=1 Tax=Ziziphus jujuba var. spinosa TaxID=714518 RepID=A0A978VG74_ZIZJJ|nr:hypothetical protein FEM48_Zijuj05G0176300 [Ziziphus jujuba var. spinosa]